MSAPTPLPATTVAELAQAVYRELTRLYERLDRLEARLPPES